VLNVCTFSVSTRDTRIILTNCWRIERINKWMKEKGERERITELKKSKHWISLLYKNERVWINEWDNNEEWEEEQSEELKKNRKPNKKSCLNVNKLPINMMQMQFMARERNKATPIETVKLSFSPADRSKGRGWESEKNQHSEIPSLSYFSSLSLALQFIFSFFPGSYSCESILGF